MPIQVKVNGPRGEEKIIDLCDSEEQLKRITVKDLKTKIAQELRISMFTSLFSLTEQLEESCLLLSYGIKHLSTIHTLLMLPGGI
uniref:Ubiquitin-like domain-containing protein n=1 Tax=Dicentrarchus labrax TaxID=13489 RepID=A0A8C4GJF0_DICLA